MVRIPTAWCVGGAAALVVLVSPTLAALAQDAGPAEAGYDRLRPVSAQESGAQDPAAEAQEGADAPTLKPLRAKEVAPGLRPTAPFADSAWAARLSTPDLDRREANFEQIVELARRDDTAREWLQRVSVDVNRPDLAWTARLALRELRSRPSSPNSGGRGLFGPTLDDPFDGLWFESLGDGDPFDEIRERLRAMSEGDALRLPRGEGSRGSSVRIEETDDGVKVTITETVEGDEESTTYEASTMDELYEAHPELREKVEGSGPRLRLRLREPDAAIGDWSDAWEELRRLFRQDDFVRPEPDDVAEDEPRFAERTDVLGVYVGAPSEQLLEHLGLDEGEGIVVLRTEPGTIAGILGLGRGDVLLSVNGRSMGDQDAVSEVMKSRKPGEELTVVWLDFGGQKHRRTWVPALGQ